MVHAPRFSRCLAPRLASRLASSALLFWVLQSGLLPIVALSQALPSGMSGIPSEELAQPDAFSGYQLGAGDTLYINVLRFPDLSFQGTIDLEGNLLVPLVGALSLRGLTPEQARNQIQTALDRYVVNPQVDVILIAQRSVQVTILGEVVKPGLYPLQAPQLSVALLSAGGTTRLADLRTVLVRRVSADGSIAERQIDLFTSLRDSQSIPDLRLDDGDTIVVPALTATDGEGYDRNPGCPLEFGTGSNQHSRSQLHGWQRRQYWQSPAC